MNLPFGTSRVVVVRHIVDFRKGFNGLLAESYRLGFNPYNGDCIVFIKRDRTQVRALSGDTRGLYLINRRFDGGRLGLKWQPSQEKQCRDSTLAELAMIFDGNSYTIHRQIKPWKFP